MSVHNDIAYCTKRKNGIDGIVIISKTRSILNIVKVNAVPWLSNFTLIVETNLFHLLNLYIDYSKAE